MTRRVVFAQAGNHPELRQAAQYVESQDRDVEYCTGSAVPAGSVAARTLSAVFGASRSRNRVVAMPRPVRVVPLGTVRIAARSAYGRLRSSRLSAQHNKSSETFSKLLARRFEHDPPDVCVVQEGDGLDALDRALDLGIGSMVHSSSIHPAEVNSVCESLFERYNRRYSSILRYRYSDWYVDRVEDEFRKASRIQVLSEVAATSMTRRGVPPSKIFINLPGVDLRHFSPVRLPEPCRCLRLVFVGRGTALKGLLDLVMAMRVIGSQAILDVVGPVDSDLQHEVARETNIRMHGKCSRQAVRELMAAADALVLPSYFEGLGISVVEAMAIGRPVLISEAIALSTVVQNAHAGLTFGAGNVEQIVDRVHSLHGLRSEWPEMARAAVELSSQFRWDSFCRNTWGHVEQISSSTPPLTGAS